MLQLISQLLFFMLLLIVSGEPFRVIFLRRLKVFSDLDFIQIFILDACLGGMILYFYALLPFGLFSLYFLGGFTLFCLFFSFYIHSKTLRRLRSLGEIKASLTGNRKMLFDYTLVFGFFVFLLVINIASTSNLVFGGIFDESIHSLKVEVIMENGQIPFTLQPYLPEGIVYPPAAHVIYAFASLMLNFTVPKSVFYVTLLFKALPVFAAYFLGKKLDGARLYPLGLAFVFAFVSSWPLYVGWGSNPFLVGFPLFLVNLGLFFSLLRSEKSSLAELVAVGFLFGYNGAIMVSYIQILAVVTLIVAVYWLAKPWNSGRRKLHEFSALFLASLLVLSPLFYRFFAFYPYPGHNIGLPADFQGFQSTRLPFTMTQALEWAFNNLSPYYDLRLWTLFLFAGFALLLWKAGNYREVKSVGAFALTVFVSAVLLSSVSFFLPSDLEVISWGHQGILIAVSLSILVAVLYVTLVRFCQNRGTKLLSRFFSKSSYSAIVLAVMLFAVVNAPFVYYRLSEDPRVLGDTYRMFAVTTTDDYNLMVWMKANLTREAVILVSPYEPGLFIPSISQHKIVYPYTASQFSQSYQSLVYLLRRDVLNSTAYGLMGNLSISYVYVGSDAAYWWFEKQKWNPLLFLGNPNFKLVKNFGNAYLFQLQYAYPNTVFREDFKHGRWDENGWNAYFYGNGLGNVTITNSSRSSAEMLQITSQAVYTVTWQEYASYISREIFVGNNSDVALSFYLDATQGFNDRDTFAAIISNVYRNQSLVITTPGGIYKDYSPRISLGGFRGTFTFNDLSNIWRQMLNSPMPSSFILEFANWDLDGVKNVAYIDNITVSAKPAS